MQAESWLRQDQRDLKISEKLIRHTKLPEPVIPIQGPVSYTGVRKRNGHSWRPGCQSPTPGLCVPPSEARGTGRLEQFWPQSPCFVRNLYRPGCSCAHPWTEAGTYLCGFVGMCDIHSRSVPRPLTASKLPADRQTAEPLAGASAGERCSKVHLALRSLPLGNCS